MAFNRNTARDRQESWKWYEDLEHPGMQQALRNDARPAGRQGFARNLGQQLKAFIQS